MSNQIENTPRIIEKYTNEEGQVDVERMASKMSSIREQNFTLKRVLLFSSIFLVVGVCLMISANVLGTYVLKDTKVKNNQLVTKDGKPVSVGVNLYKTPVYLFSSADVLDGLKYLEVPVTIDGTGSTLHMEINSYISTFGKQIIFIGEKYCLLLQRHNYELFLNDASFDPLSLNGTNTNDVNNNNEDNSTETSAESNLRRNPAVKSIFRSQQSETAHKRIHPTVEHAKRIAEGEDTTQEFVSLSGRGSVAAQTQQRALNNLVYHSGNPLVTNGKVIMIVWNDQTNGRFGASNLKTCYDNLPTFFNDLLKTKLFTQLTPGKKGSDPQSKVSSIDQTVRYLSPSAARKKVTLYDSDIGNQLMDWLNAGQLPKDTSNKLNYMYMIFFPSGIKLSSGFCSSYCGFHTYRSGYIYSVLPWVGDCMGSCGMSSYVSTFGGNTCGSLQSVAAHELTEMATDPYLSTYYDVNGWENADKCAWTSPACYKNPSSGNSYCIQQQWNHTASSSGANDAGCTRNLQW